MDTKEYNSFARGIKNRVKDNNGHFFHMESHVGRVQISTVYLGESSPIHSYETAMFEDGKCIILGNDYEPEKAVTRHMDAVKAAK